MKVDGQPYKEGDALWNADNMCTAYQVSGLEDSEHTVTIEVASGSLAVDAIAVIGSIYNSDEINVTPKKGTETGLPEEELPKTLTSYSPCFRKEKGAHGLEERGVYRIHQFEKQEMIVVCKPEESKMWFDKLWQNTVDLFRSLDIPVRTLECCSGDLADLKVKSLDVEAWSPRQKKYFEVGSCSNLGDAQARRLKIRVNGKDGKKYLAHTLNNTVVAPPRMLIAFLENNLNADGSVNIPKALQPYMGGMTKIEKKTRA